MDTVLHSVPSESPARVAPAGWDEYLAVHAPVARRAPAEAEPDELTAGCILCDLSDYGLIEATGADAERFLHGQLSSDVRALGPARSQLSTYNSPKGRVLATLLLWRTGSGFIFQVPGSIAAGLRKRLAMFVLRSKVQLLPAEERLVRLAVCGDTAADTVRNAGLPVPETDFDLAPLAGAGDAAAGWILRLPGKRYLVVAEVERARNAWGSLERAGARPGTSARWHWASVRSGIAEIVAATQDQWVPQMLNYELLGAVSFTKGCYPGQEIVARTQYRGELKRRTLLLHADAPAPAPGTPVLASGAPEQSVGAVLASARAPEGGSDLLACVHLDLAQDAELRLGSVDGARLERLPLPYALPAAR